MTVRDMLMATGPGGILPAFVSSSSNSAGVSNVTVTAPTSMQDGDLLVSIAYTSPVAKVTPPSGFVQVSGEDNTADPGVFISSKVAASESGNYTFTNDTPGGGGAFSVVILVYRNATRVNTVGSIYRTTANTFARGQSITPSYSGVLLASFTRANTGTVATTPAGMTLRAGPTFGPYNRVYELSGQSAAPTGDKDLTYTTTSSHTGLLLQVTNEPALAPTFVASASTQTDTASTTTVTVNKPAGTVEGDLMVAVMSGGATNLARTWTGDTGWTEVADENAVPNLRVAYKVAGAAEGSSYTFTASLSTTYGLAASILTYRYAAYDAVSSFASGSDPLILPSLTAAESQSVLLAIGTRAAASVALGAPTGMATQVSDSNAIAPSYIVCDQTVAKGPAGVRGISTGSSTNVAGIALSIKPTRTP